MGEHKKLFFFFFENVLTAARQNKVLGTIVKCPLDAIMRWSTKSIKAQQKRKRSVPTEMQQDEEQWPLAKSEKETVWTSITKTETR
jgi:hypothetical protein